MKIASKLFSTIFLIVLVCSKANAAKTVADINKDTVIINPKITEQHYTLKAINYYVYIIPPDNTFKEIKSENEFGLESKERNARIELKFQGSNNFEYVDGIMNRSLTYYSDLITKYKLLKSNGTLIKYMKYSSLIGNDTMTTWNVICGDDLFGLLIMLRYPTQEDDYMDKLVERLLHSIIIKPNPLITPETNMVIDFDYSLLDLKFFQRSLAYTIFSEDGLPPKLSKGSKFFLVSTNPPSGSQQDNLADQVIDLINDTFFDFMPGKILATRVEETVINGQNGIEVEGYFDNDEDKVFIMFMAATMDRYNIIIAFCKESESKDFFAKVREVKETIKLN